MALARGTITVDKQPNGGPYTSITKAHDNGGATLLLATIHVPLTGSLTVTSPQYNSVALTAIGNSDNTDAGGGSVWAGYIINPTSGSNNFTATITSSNSSYTTLTPITGADLINVVGSDQTTETSTGASSSVSQTNTMDTDDSWHFLAWALRDGFNPIPITPGTGMVEDIDDSTGSNTFNDVSVWLGHKVITATGSDTVAATAGSSERESGMSFEILAAAAAAGGELLSLRHIKNFNRELSGGMR